MTNISPASKKNYHQDVDIVTQQRGGNIRSHYRVKMGLLLSHKIMEIFEEVQVQNKKKNTRNLFFCKKKASGIRITGSLHPKSLDKTGKKAKKMVRPQGLEPWTQ